MKLNKLKQDVKNALSNKVNQVVLVTSFGAVVAADSANAALDPAVTGAFSILTGAFNDLLAAAYPIMATITTGLIIFGMVKMFLHKSAGR